MYLKEPYLLDARRPSARSFLNLRDLRKTHKDNRLEDLKEFHTPAFLLLQLLSG